jgi:hypothetical protein
MRTAVSPTAAPPLDRALLDANLRPARTVLGLLFIAYCALTTIDGVHALLLPRLSGPVLAGYYGYGVLAGLIVATVVSAVEWLCAEHYPPAYLVALAVDMWFSYWPLAWFWRPILQAQLADSWTMELATVSLSLVLAWAAARYGELLLFGRRRG